jgi:hypothetical protein
MFVMAQNRAKLVRGDGPTWKRAWNEATDAKQHIAMNAKKIWIAWKAIAGFDRGIYSITCV